MATLEIEGRDVEVDDKFLTLSSDEQNRIVHDIAAQIGIKGRGSQEAPKPQPKPESNAGRAGLLGAVDTATFGFGDEAAAGLGYLLDKLPGERGRTYEELLATTRGAQKDAQEANPGAYLGGQIAGGVSSGLGLARSGLSLGANAIRGGANLGRAAVASAADGAIVGGISGVGGGEGVSGRIAGGTAGLLTGGALGGAAPYATAIAGAAARPFIAPLASRLNPEGYANAALAKGIRRSGRTVDDIARELDAARMDGQGVYNVADALGNEGQRMLSTVTRTPNDGRQLAVDALEARQAGQGERLSSALADAFDATDTAVQRTARLTAERRAAAGANYDAARADAGPVDVSGALRVTDDILTPGASGLANPGTSIADDTLENAVRRARALFTDDRSRKMDFNQVLRAKHDIQDRIAVAERSGQGNKVRVLSQINRELDAALERSSSGYRQANDTFRQQSRAIDAVDAGGAAASSRTRASDNIPAFNAMTPDEQSSFRVGYADPLIGRVESASSLPTTNKARLLMTEKSGQEFPAFAVPGRGDQLTNRIGREQRMFETYTAARGGSKTADNLADAAETAQADASIVFNAIAMRPGPMVAAAVTTALRQAQGLPAPVIRRMAETLLETNPQAAREMLGRAMQSRTNNDNVRALGNAILVTMSANGRGPGR